MELEGSKFYNANLLIQYMCIDLTNVYRRIIHVKTEVSNGRSLSFPSSLSLSFSWLNAGTEPGFELEGGQSLKQIFFYENKN